MGVDPRDIGDVVAARLLAAMSEPAAEGITGMTSGLRADFTPEQSRSVLTTTPTTLGEWAFRHLRQLLQR